MALAAGDKVLGLTQLAIAHGQAEALLPLVERTMRQVALPASAIELVAVTTGPGSFTGIR
ncbi:MAG: tRNA (adenosine(37)-N6)-threonylcarbamoyltransferase complex dimerization subunit type 1 TsaB, partial [Stellaceae bacterium]